MISQQKVREAFVRERKQRGISFRTAQDETGVHSSNLNRFEHGTNLDMDGFVKVARWLKMPLSEGVTVAYPKNTLDAILAVIRADDKVTDKDSLCTLFSVCYRGMVNR